MLRHLAHQLLSEVENLNAYGLFSLLLFFAFFTGVMVWAFALKKNHLEKMGNLPLDGGERPQSSPENSDPNHL
jgi:cbb3-type cytochrome oxidase subunit 3